MILCFDDEVAFARALGLASGLPVQRIARHRFPDGELKLTLPPKLGAEVRILRSLHAPNEKLVELILAARTARELGARDLTLVAPYLAYMRQDSAFAAGEVVSQRVIGRLLADLFDAVVTVDPHLHRVATLAEAIPLARVVALSAAPLIGHFVAMRGRSPMLVGPDAESAQWVHVAATFNGLPWTRRHRGRGRTAGRADRGARSGAGRRRRQQRSHAGGGLARPARRRGGKGRRGGHPRGAGSAGRRDAESGRHLGVLEHRYGAAREQRAVGGTADRRRAAAGIGDGKSKRPAQRAFFGAVGAAYFRCLLTSLVSSNMSALALPNSSRSFSSALIMRLLTASCSLFFLM